jgi:hypothetical protein
MFHEYSLIAEPENSSRKNNRRMPSRGSEDGRTLKDLTGFYLKKLSCQEDMWRMYVNSRDKRQPAQNLLDFQDLMTYESAEAGI